MRVGRKLWSWAGLRHFVDQFRSGDPEESPKQPTTDISSVTEDTTDDEGTQWKVGDTVAVAVSNGKPLNSDFE